MKVVTVPSFTVESGNLLTPLQIAFHTYGKYLPGKTPVVWVCHALTGSSDVFSWWKGLFGEGDLFNPSDFFIVCANNLGSCYGSTGPLQVNPDTGHPYYHLFPRITIRDMTNFLIILRKELGIETIDYLIGGSQGGQIALEWAIHEPERIRNLILICTNARHSAWGIAFNESQRMAIFSDCTYLNQNPEAGKKGLQAARSIAMLSYRNYITYEHFQSDSAEVPFDQRRAVTYQRYQGEKLAKRFNAFSYVILAYAMDSHDVFRARQNDILKTVQARSCVIGIAEDILFPLQEQRFLADSIPNAELHVLHSLYGHDGFLVETDILSRILEEFISSAEVSKRMNIHENT
jgi:homoserine O-acetyltransferase